jgi:hypothetical protein
VRNLITLPDVTPLHASSNIVPVGRGGPGGGRQGGCVGVGEDGPRVPCAHNAPAAGRSYFLTPRATTPPWVLVAACGRLHFSLETAGFPVSTLTPFAETIILAGPLTVRNRAV